MIHKTKCLCFFQSPMEPSKSGVESSSQQAHEQITTSIAEEATTITKF